MLLQLNIKNFALIDELSINFQEGFNVLTGETGTGKSILIDAISFVLGGKFNRGIIRNGEERAYVEGVFTIENEKVLDLLKELNIPCDDNLVIINREIFSGGKSIIKINNITVIVSKLKQIGAMLLDIHGQHENINLLNQSVHINYIDNFGERSLEEKLLEFKKEYENYVGIEERISSIASKSQEKEKLIDFINFQIQEIEKAKLKIGEYEELEENYKILSNAESINKVLNNSYSILHNGDDSNNSVSSAMLHCIKELRSVEKHSKNIAEIVNTLEEVFYTLEESIRDIGSIKDDIVYDPNELDYINSRIYQIDTLKRKYGNSVEEILGYKNKLAVELDEILNSIEIIEKLKSEKNKSYEKLLVIGKELHTVRSEVGAKLQELIQIELSYIGLEKSKIFIDIAYEENNFNNRGFDKVTFMISTNPGEPLASLEKIVSGGELSRIMLAIKTVLIHKDNIPSVIFDEVDTGISGRVAVSVAEKMYNISTKHQVFCVTHLPQIAVMSDAHFIVTKEVFHDKTYSKIKKLDFDEKVKEIARMTGGSEVSDLTLRHAKEMIELSQAKKNDIREKII